MDGVLNTWLDSFNRGDFYEAHEVVEDAWRVAEEPDRTFLKGLIHISVALCHYQRSNGHGARVKYASGLRYLEPYQPHYRGIDLHGLARQLDRFFAPLLALPRGTPPPPSSGWPSAARLGSDLD